MRNIVIGSVLSVILAFSVIHSVLADSSKPFAGTLVLDSRYAYQELVDRLIKAVADNKMGVVARASATQGAKSLGVTIAGNQIIMVFHPRFAIRMLQASIMAGIEAPLRFYVTENEDGTSTLIYRSPSSVFAPYENQKLDAMALELDSIFMRIAASAVAP